MPRRTTASIHVPHIAILFEFGTLNGGEHSMLAAMDRLAGQFQFTAMAPPQGRLADALRARGISHVPFSVRSDGIRRPTDAICAELRTIVDQLRSDLLHANSLSMGRVTGALHRRAGGVSPLPPCVAHLRDVIRLSATAVADLNRNQRLIAVSQATRAFHVTQGIDPTRTEVIYNGVDLEQFRPRPATGWLKRELSLPDNSYLIATIGQIGLRKGQDVLAQAAAQIGSRPSEVHFLLIGERLSAKSESRAYEQLIARTFAAAGLGSRLHWLGYRSDLPMLMNEVDLLVHPAKQEPLGRVLLEALASGLPIIATAVGGTREILTNGETGRLVPANDPVALADAILELHDQPELAKEFATAGRERAIRVFDINTAAANLAALWRDTRQQ